MNAEDFNNIHVYEALVKCEVQMSRHHEIVVSVSGGSDSDIMMDMIERTKKPYNNIRYVWFDTGLEYAATKRHLEYLEKRYGVTIERVRGMPIPSCVKKYGQPFLSKHVSEALGRLQAHGFKWEWFDTVEEMQKAYPNMPIGVMKFWTNAHREGEQSMFNISWHSDLKEYLVENPPQFQISSNCCTYSKKKPAHDYRKNCGADMECVGVRRAEGGIRAANYKNCFTPGDDIDHFRPLFWLSDEDKRDYEEQFGIVHSDCYIKWGFQRTGCVGCPFNLRIFKDIEVVEQYEPMMAKACKSVFKDSYEYTRKYREYHAEKMARKKQPEGAISMFDYMREQNHLPTGLIGNC